MVLGLGRFGRYLRSLRVELTRVLGGMRTAEDAPAVPRVGHRSMSISSRRRTSLAGKCGRHRKRPTPRYDPNEIGSCPKIAAWRRGTETMRTAPGANAWRLRNR